ncbi:hypothetical protein LCGC14_1590510 [marine sediment metagenome]|uniref:Uncharacterized protein n=1 Tax=marine sediment metagenome TaxID=412755 RepID=A0A0F9J0D7_9ZZZZ
MEEELPQYKCHKIVGAAKITALKDAEEGKTLVFGEIDRHRYVGSNWLDQNRTMVVGGYFVVYVDGYTAYSPAQAFEEGYTKVDT